MEDVGMFMHWALGYSHEFSYHKSRGDWRLAIGDFAHPPWVHGCYLIWETYEK